MKQTSIGGIDPGKQIGEMSNEELESLWSQIVRNRRPEELTRLTRLIRSECKPSSESEEHILEIGREMVRRNLFASMCLVA